MQSSPEHEWDLRLQRKEPPPTPEIIKWPSTISGPNATDQLSAMFLLTHVQPSNRGITR